MSIHLILGPMFAGKTSELLRLKTRSDLSGFKTLLVKYKGDTRYDIHENDKNLYTHNKNFSEAYISFSLNELLSDEMNIYDCFFIDEIQFYKDADVVVNKLADNGKHVIVSGLQGDYNRNIFPIISKLIPLSDKITHLTAIDTITKTDASFTLRMVNDSKFEIIGGSELYMAVSRQTYNNHYKTN